MDNLKPLKNRSVNLLKIILVIIVASYMFYYLATLAEWHFIDNINLIFHEAGHVIFVFFGRFVQTLGGTLMQLLIPTVCLFYFYKNNDNFSASLLLFWISQNFFNISVYARDAVKMELPLLGGDSVGHDWNSILSSMNLLNHTDKIASLFYCFGILILIFAIVFSIRNSVSYVNISK